MKNREKKKKRRRNDNFSCCSCCCYFLVRDWNTDGQCCTVHLYDSLRHLLMLCMYNIAAAAGKKVVHLIDMTCKVNKSFFF